MASNRKKGHSRLLNSIRISLVSSGWNSCFLSQFSSTGVCSDYTSSFYIHHCFERKIIDAINYCCDTICILRKNTNKDAIDYCCGTICILSENTWLPCNFLVMALCFVVLILNHIHY